MITNDQAPAKEFGETRLACAEPTRVRLTRIGGWRLHRLATARWLASAQEAVFL